MSEIFNYCNVVGRTDIGRKRSANEDSMDNAVTINGLVSVVCDGMYNHQNEMRRRLKRNAYFDTETKCGIYLTQHIRKALNYCSNGN